MTNLPPETLNNLDSQVGNGSLTVLNPSNDALLTQSPQSLQAVVASLPVIIWATDLNGMVTVSTGSGLGILGLQPGELVGRSILDLHKDHPINSENIQRGLAGEQRTWTSTYRNIVYEHRFMPVQDRGGNVTGLTGISVDITERVQVEKALRHQARRERLVALIGQRIRSSLQLDHILHTTVAELRQFFQSDRVLIYRFSEKERGIVVAESVDRDYTSKLGMGVNMGCLGISLEAYGQGECHVIQDIETSNLNVETLKFLRQGQVKSRLAVPILVEDEVGDNQSQTRSNRTWGLLVADHCAKIHHWHRQEINLLTALATQVAIAIRQAQLYAKLEESKRQLEESNRELLRLASMDWLTQTANRLRFDECINQEWRQMARENACIALIMGDIDYFKAYNDTYGHPEGDRCLQKVAMAINKTVKRPRDLVARYGGEEFVIILPTTDVEGANFIAEQIRASVKALKIEHEESPIDRCVTISLGVAAMVPPVGSPPSVLIAAADYALYEAKGRGRDRIYSIG
jgi:diguanylate cyclase (GGDEF)-like protein/PAS domain S-box-containing protein